MGRAAKNCAQVKVLCQNAHVFSLNVYVTAETRGSNSEARYAACIYDYTLTQETCSALCQFSASQFSDVLTSDQRSQPQLNGFLHCGLLILAAGAV